jgi:hypothetical protein
MSPQAAQATPFSLGPGARFVPWPLVVHSIGDNPKWWSGSKAYPTADIVPIALPEEYSASGGCITMHVQLPWPQAEDTANPTATVAIRDLNILQTFCAKISGNPPRAPECDELDASW